MADHADDGDDYDGNIFIYRGGRAPRHVTHVRIDRSVDVIEEGAFNGCEDLVHVETHDGIRRVDDMAFSRCKLLRWINLLSAVGIGEFAFYLCTNLVSVEFGDKLETIRRGAFGGCSSLEHLKLPSIITIGRGAFANCIRLTDIEFSERLETIGARAFDDCARIERIAIPLKRDLFEYDDNYRRYKQFDGCDQLKRVDLVGGAHTKTVASLHMESWRTEMIAEINRINQVLPNTHADDTAEAIRQWIGSTLDKMDHYKGEHYRYVKEGITLLELALWKANLGEKEEKYVEEKRGILSLFFYARAKKKAKIDAESARKERRITCGADIVIKNLLPFLKLK